MAGAAWVVVACAGLGIALAACGGKGGNGVEAAPAPPTTGKGAGMWGVRYDRDIRPLLSDRCFKCHGPDAAARKAGLRLDEFASATSVTRGEGGGEPAAIVPGDAAGSEVWKRLNASDPEDRMPPEGSNKRPLSAEEKELVRRWIAEGAKYEKHWSFVAPVRPGAPEVRNGGWCRNEIDRFVLARLEQEGIAPSPEADGETLVRRVFLDLTGLPPTPEEVDAYLADGSAHRYEDLVERLLTREPYRSRTAERMATPWLDAARYADTCGIHTDNGRQMWAWRDWVLGAFRDNMPFDLFATEQLAGDLIPNATMEQRVASGFNRNHVTTDEGGAIAEEYLVEYAVDRAATTATTFLGLTMGCARCHDHKFDPISHEEFYRFYAYFNSIDEPGLYSQTPDSNRAHEPFMEVPTAQQRAEMDALGKEIEGLRALQARTTPAEEAEHAAFLKEFARETGAAWARSEVVSARAESAAKLSVQEDGSVLASGANPPTDVHEVVIRPAPGSAALRVLLLEALEHPTLGKGRVGRAGNGNAVLTGIEVESFSRGEPEKVKKHEVEWLWADMSQLNGDYRFTNLLVKGSGADRGWAVDGHMQKGDRHLLVLLKDGIVADGGTDVRVRLRYESVHAQHVFGRVRVTLGTMSDVAKLPTEMSNFWLAGPFASDGKAKPYDDTIGPEGATTIDFTRSVGAGNQYWRYDPNVRDGAVAALPDGNNVSFVGRLIVTPTSREMPVSLGSDDGFVLFLNGKEVSRHVIERGVAPDQDSATLQLAAGVNVVVMKIVNTGGAAGCYFKPQPSADGQYPHDLVGALLPEEKRGAGSAETIKQAWRAARSPAYRERAQRVETLDRAIGDIRARVPKTMVMKELDVARPTFVLTRGQYDQPDKARPVTRGVPAFLASAEGNMGGTPTPRNRLGLAKWLVSAENPLTARVEVNRLWEMVFGAGLVRTSEDFGQQGEWPSHPELLDALAVEFRESGWDVRRIVRMMVTSATYRQRSSPRGELMERDPDNRLLARAPRRRLSAEQIRDQALYVSGLLVEKFGGPSVKPYQPEGLWKEGALPGSNSQVYERGKGEDLYRRSVYTYWKRAAPMPDMQAFDAPTREYCVVRRAVTGTPLQALVLWNDPAFVEAARVLAARTMGESGDDAARIGVMFRRCTGHVVEEKEREALVRALEAHRARFAGSPEDAARLLGVGDSRVADGTDKPELAAWTMVAGVILNLYRVTTLE
jgi:hypothetical protein